MKASWFYISFARRKAEGGFRGATVVQANDAAGALEEATRRNLNAGGEAQVIPIPPDRIDRPELVALRNRLVGRDELIALASGEVTIGAYHENAEVICNDCNPRRPA